MNRRGMSLIELLVGMFMATVVAYIAFDLIKDENANYTKTRTKVRLQSDAREAIRIIEEDLANIGYRRGLRSTPIGTDGASRINGRLLACDSISLENRVVVQDDNGASSDSIDAYFFRPDPSMGVDCQSAPIQVHYAVRAGRLIRVYTDESGNVTSSWLLDSVVTMQVQTDQDTFLLSTEAAAMNFNTPIVHAEGDRSTSWTYDNVTRGPQRQLTSNGDSSFQILGWNAGNVATAKYTSPNSLARSSTYQVSLMLKVNQEFANAFTGSATSGKLSLAALMGADTIGKTNIGLPTIIGGPTWISWIVRTNDTAPAAMSLVFQGNVVRNIAGETPILELGNINVKRLSGLPTLSTEKNRMYWQNGQTTPAFCKQTKGLRIWLVSKSARANQEDNASNPDTSAGNWTRSLSNKNSKNTFLFTERIIPVVHYGY